MDDREFGERVRACAHRLHRIAYLILRNESDCEDAAQESLLRAWRGLYSLRDERYFETWLIRILINECKKILRARARRSASELPDAFPDLRGEPADVPLRDAILALDKKIRVPLILHHLEGYTQEEVARILHVSVAAVKWRLHQARKLIRIDLEEDDVR